MSGEKDKDFEEVVEIDEQGRAIPRREEVHTEKMEYDPGKGPLGSIRGGPDPWAHRSTMMKCKTCMWFVMKHGNVLTDAMLGRCRRRSPTMGGYPPVFTSDWCGSHKLDENKI